MKPRICIFAAETLLHWSGYYVRAFRQSCDVVVMGPKNEPANHDFPDWDRVAPYVIENDIHTTSTDAATRLALLPAGWEPELLVVIQSGDVLIGGIASVECPTVYLSIDSWHDSNEFQRAYPYDFVFMAQKALCKYMRRMGCCRVFWLPLACDPEHHYAIAQEVPESDIAFVGSTHFFVNRQRAARLDVLDQHFNVKLFFGLGTVEMAEAYGQSRLIFNASIACDVNMRVFEALATGLPLITNREAVANGLLELFEDRVHLLTYDDDDLVSTVQWCLDNPTEAKAIGAAGRRAVLAQHTYGHRVQEILVVLGRYHIQVGDASGRPVRKRLHFRDFLPRGSLRVLDLGLGLQSSRVALSHRGVEHVVGVALDGDSFQRRGNSYDVLWPHPDVTEPTGDFDTVVWSTIGRTGQTLAGMANYSRRWLTEGGRFMFSLAEEELLTLAGALTMDAVTGWIRGGGCQLVLWRPPEDGRPEHVFIATPVNTTMRTLNADLYGEFPLNGTMTEPWNETISAPTPDSPDAEDR